MKFLILSLMLSTSVMANEYVQRSGSCHVTADVQDFFNPATRLPFTLQLRYTFSYLKNTGELVGTKFETSTESNNTAPHWAQSTVATIEQSIAIDSTYTGTTTANFDLTKDQTNALLVYLGSYRAENLGGALPTTTYTNQIPGQSRTQVHLDADYGISFHIYTNCNFSGATRGPGQDQGGTPTPPTRPTPPVQQANTCSFNLENSSGRVLHIFSARSQSLSSACTSAESRCLDAARNMRGLQFCQRAR